MSGAAQLPEAQPDVSVLVPVYGSGGMAAASARRIFDALRGCGAVELVFCDDGSPDDSLRRLHELPAPERPNTIRVLSHPNRGLAFTLRRLISEARGPACAYLDMDLSFDVERLPRLLMLLARHHIVVGSKYAGDTPRQVPVARLVSSVAFRMLVYSSTPVRVKDIGSGMVAFRREPIVRLGLDSEGFAIHAELLDRAALAGLSVREEPVAYHHVPGSFSIARHGLVAVRDFVAYRLRRRAP